MSERVTISKQGGVADVRLSRPEKMNALDAAMFEALIDAGDTLAADPSLRCVVLSGEGRAFCAGLDFASFAGMVSGDGPLLNLFDRAKPRVANVAQQAAYTWTELPAPVIAAVHGVAFGGGLQIALGADIRLVTADARLSVMEIKWGLVPDMAGTQTLRRLVRLDVAKELTFTGRVVSGNEAVALGLATRVCDEPHGEAMQMAGEIASRSPDAVRAAKSLLNRAGVVSPEEGLLLEEKAQASLIGKPNQIEAVRANMEKRDPRFDNPC
jgi:enoyl-CoA hydratase/carnithine racemase